MDFRRLDYIVISFFNFHLCMLCMIVVIYV
jgi:hypothetical protein